MLAAEVPLTQEEEPEDPETQWGESLVEACAEAAEGCDPPPVYGEQGQTRGRKPAKSKLEQSKKVAGKKKARNGRCKRTRKAGRKNGAKSSAKGEATKAEAKAKANKPVDGPSASGSVPAIRRRKHLSPEGDGAEGPKRSKRAAKGNRTKEAAGIAEPEEVEPKPSKPAAKAKRTKQAAEIAEPEEVETVEPKPSKPAAKAKAKRTKEAAVPAVELREPEPSRPKRKAPVLADNDGDRNNGEEEAAPKKVRSRPLTRDEVPIPEDAIDAPSTCTGNGVYSCAYRRAELAGKTADECRAAARHRF